MVETILWLYHYLRKRYATYALSKYARSINGHVYLEVNLPRLARVSKKVHTKSGIFRQLYLLREQGYIHLTKLSGRLYYRMGNRLEQLGKPFIDHLETRCEPVVNSLLLSGNLTIESGNESNDSLREESMGAKAVKVFELYRYLMASNGYIPITKPTQKDANAILGLLKAFENLDISLDTYLIIAIGKWSAIRKDIGDYKVSPTPTLTELCVKRQEVMKAYSMLASTDSILKTKKEKLTPEELEQARREERL